MAQEAAAGSAVIHQLGVSVIVNHYDVVFLCKGNELVIEPLRRKGASGVIGIGYNHQLGSPRQLFGDGVQVDEIIVLLFQRHIV